MANFDEDIKRITDEVLSDGTVDRIIREKVTKGIEGAISDSFSYGKLRNAIKERTEEVLVPFIEKYDMRDYVVKLDTILSEIISKTVLVDNKKLLENFRYLMEEPQEKQIKLTDLFREYNKFVSKNMETSGRDVETCDGDVKYKAINTFFTFEKEDRAWSCFKHAVVTFGVEEEDQQEELNMTLYFFRYKYDTEEGWKFRAEIEPNLHSLRTMNDFALLLTRLERSDVRLLVDKEEDDDSVYSEEEPEVTYE